MAFNGGLRSNVPHPPPSTASSESSSSTTSSVKRFQNTTTEFPYARERPIAAHHPSNRASAVISSSSSLSSLQQPIVLPPKALMGSSNSSQSTDKRLARHLQTSSSLKEVGTRHSTHPSSASSASSSSLSSSVRFSSTTHIMSRSSVSSSAHAGSIHTNTPSGGHIIRSALDKTQTSSSLSSSSTSSLLPSLPQPTFPLLFSPALSYSNPQLLPHTKHGPLTKKRVAQVIKKWESAMEKKKEKDQRQAAIQALRKREEKMRVEEWKRRRGMASSGMPTTRDQVLRVNVPSVVKNL
ncbi:hypothetical protein ADUPG1_010470 [Aduncisulcus paluster]|uniref:Remorin C-terminal domain-containing protein n=1 Tax=Aduncisulcus paluster TaxID=2918883 RepID=A0ABQ5JRI6_9EUKA|nr:hypothetical protein ADUPG1_010470 [Aduncisulcus paluster]